MPQEKNSGPSLWRNPVFLRLWTSLTITHFGGQVTFLALPLTAALVLGATPFEVGVLTALEALPYPIFGLFAGVLVDRAPKLPIIVMADIGRGLALLAIPIAAWFGVLTMPLLYIVGFMIGLGSVIGWPAYQVFMTERVGRDKLVEANAKIGYADSAAQLIGPGIAGAAIQWLSAPIAIFLDAMCFFGSAAMLRGIPPASTDAPKVVARSVRDEIREGLATIWRIPVLRTLAWAIGVWQIFRHCSIAIIVLFAARELGFSAGQVGVLWMTAGLGSLAAAGVTTWFNAKFGMGRTMLAAISGTGISWLVIASSTGSYWVASLLFGGGLFLLDLSAMVFFINYLSLRQAVTPDRLLGRVTATMICLTVSTAPLGALVGGWLGEHVGLRAAILFAAIGALLLAPLAAWRSGLAAMRELPGPQEPAITESVTEELKT